MPQISTEDSGILLLTKNAKTNNNIAGYHLVSHRVISAPSDVKSVYRSPKKTFILLKKYHISVLDMLSYLLECFIKNKIISGTNPGTEARQSPGSSILCYPISNLKHLKYVKTNNNHTSSHLISYRVIPRSTSMNGWEKEVFWKNMFHWKSKM